MDISIQSLSSVSGAGSTTKTGKSSMAQGPNLIQNNAAKPPDFSDVLANITGNAVGNIRKAEDVSIQAVHGQANTREVVDALMTAEQSLQTAIAIRDKIVTAYLDVTRMQM